MIPHRVGAIHISPTLAQQVGQRAALVAGVLQAALIGVKIPHQAVLSYTAEEIADGTQGLMDVKAVKKAMRTLVVARVVSPLDQKTKRFPSLYTVALDPVDDETINTPIVGEGIGEWVEFGDDGSAVCRYDVDGENGGMQ